MLLDHLTVDQYREYKEQDFTDRYIAEKILFVSLSLLESWKRKNKVTSQYRIIRERKLQPDKIIELHQLGLIGKEIADRVGCSNTAVYRIINKYKRMKDNDKGTI